MLVCWVRVIGFLLFSLGYHNGVIAPTDRDAFDDFQADRLPMNYQPFSAFVYSLDSFLPIINLGLKDRWMPDPQLEPRTKTLTRTCFGDLVAACFPRFAALPIFTSGKVLRRYLWCHLLFG
jgi:hypothetical protein